MVTARSSLTVPGAAAAAKIAADQGWTRAAAAVAPPLPPPCRVRRRRGPQAAEHWANRRVNPDASRFYAAGSTGPVPHERSGRAGSPDNGGRRRAASFAGPPRHTVRRNKSGRDRNGCRSAPEPDSARTKRTAPSPPGVRRHSGVDAPFPGGHNSPASCLAWCRHGADATAKLRSTPCRSPNRIILIAPVGGGRLRRQERRRHASLSRVAQVGKQATPHARRSVARQGTARRARVPPVRYLDNPMPVTRRGISLESGGY